MHLSATRGAPGDPGRRCRSTSRSSSRARRSSAPTACTPGSRRTATAWRPTSRSSATPASSRATSRRSRSACAGIMYAQIDVRRSRRSTSIRAGTAAPSRTRPTRSPGSSRRSRAPTAGSAIPGFYDDVVALTGGRPRGDAPRCRSTRRPTGPRSRPAGARRRGGLDDARAPRRPARRSTSTGSGAASRARAPRRSSRPTPTPRSPRGSWRTRTRRRSSRRSGRYVAEVAPPGVTVSATVHPRRRAEPDPDRPPGDAGRRPRPRGRPRRGTPCTSARAARSRSRASFDNDPRAAGRAARLHPARLQRPRPQRVARRCATSRRRSGSSARLWDELAPPAALRPAPASADMRDDLAGWVATLRGC